MRRLRVLIVEQATRLGPLVREAVAPLSCDVHEIREGAVALERSRAALPDLVLLDPELPLVEGVALGGLLRALPNGDRVPILTLRSTIEAVTAARHFLGLVRADMNRRALTESSAFAVMVTYDGVIIEVNRGWEELLDRPRAELLGRPVAAIVDSEGSPVFDPRSDVPGERGGASSRDAHVRHSDGRLTVIELLSSQVELDGRRTGLSIARDVTARRGLEQQLRQAQKVEAVGQLAGGVAHDFNNLLSVILAQCSFLQEDPLLGIQQHDDVDEIRKAAERAAALTRQLLAFSRKQILQPRELHVNDVITDVEKMLRRLIGEDIELETRLAAHLSPVKADPGQLQQVVMNLAVNARDAMPKGGTLRIETTEVLLDEAYAAAHVGAQSGRHVLMTVHDNGSGMDLEVQSHLFEPFFTTKPEGKGTGLGLSTVHGIVRLCGGHVRVETKVGNGTTFHIYLPCVVEAALRAPHLPAKATAHGGGETVLLVEDDPMVRAMLRRVLRLRGYLVLEARRGEEALTLARAYLGPIHLLLTDVVMPGMSGGEVAAELAASRPGLRVLFVSGYTDDLLIHHRPISTAIELLQKPFAPDELARRVREMLDREPAAKPR